MNEGSQAAEVERRIERVTARLLPDRRFENRLAAPQSLQARMARLHVPAVSVAVIDRHRLDWARAFGEAEAGAGALVTTRSLFQAGSISKSVAALAIMRLVDDGVLDLDEDVNAYLKSWRVPANGAWQPRVTLRQLLSHSAGTTVHGFLGYAPSTALPSLIQILNGECPATNRRVEVTAIPGLTFRYSGGGMAVVQQLIMDVLDHPFGEVIRELVLEPLAMIDSTYAQPLPHDWAARSVSGHQSPARPLEFRHFVFPEQAAAGLWTTPIDLSKLCVAVLQAYGGERGRVLSPASAVELLSPQLPGVGGADAYMGLGFSCRPERTDVAFEHRGWNEGFVSQFRVFARIGKGAIVMTNANDGGILIEELMQSLALEYDWPGSSTKTAQAIDRGRDVIYTGHYSTPAGVAFSVTERDGQLCLVVGQQPPLMLVPISELDFFSPAVETSVAFATDDRGAIVGVTVTQAGTTIRADRQPGA